MPTGAYLASRQTRSRGSHRTAFALLLLLGPSTGACFGPSAGPAVAGAVEAATGPGWTSPTTQMDHDAAVIRERLKAAPWRLADFRPDAALEPALQAALAEQIRTLVVRFDGETVRANSPTVDLARPYELENAQGEQFDIVSPDPRGGGSSRSRCRLVDGGRRLLFDLRVDAWNGTGMLERGGS